MNDNIEEGNEEIYDDIDKTVYEGEYVRSSMEEYLEKKRRMEEKLGPAINAQGEVQNEWTSPSLEQFKELHQQSLRGGL